VSEKTIAEVQEGIVEEFAPLTEWEDRYSHLISTGKKLADISDEFKVEKFQVKGCQSIVWLVARLVEGRVVYEATSDALIVRGLIALLLRTYSGRTPDEILANVPPSFVGRIGLTENLTIGRQNGFLAMVEQMKNYALAFKTLQQMQQAAQ
jgi:cysteine desulfuration protein SufE